RLGEVELARTGARRPRRTAQTARSRSEREEDDDSRWWRSHAATRCDVSVSVSSVPSAVALEGRGSSPAGGGFRWCDRRWAKPSLRPTDSLEAFLDGVGLDLHDLRLVERAALGREHDLACYLSIRRRRRVDERVPADVGRWAERLQDLEHGHARLHLRDLVEAYVLASRRPH